ncbi:MAG: hypothetical protein KKI08_07970 [Armatimonadetes bacterium]|nr:hypothetical protein [Armatimonadota bacterium]
MGVVVWLLLQRGASWRLALPVGLNIGLSYAWFTTATEAHVHLPSAAVGLLAVAVALGVAPQVLRRSATLVVVAMLAALSAALQLNGIVFSLTAALAVGLRFPSSVRTRLLVGGATLLTALVLLSIAYAAVWRLAPSREAGETSLAQWLIHHPQNGSLGLGSPVRQALAAVSGVRLALSGPSSVVDLLKVRLFQLRGHVPVGAWDWAVLLMGGVLMMLGCAALVLTTASAGTRAEGVIAGALTALVGLSAVRFPCSDAWYWAAVVATLWYAIGLHATTRARVKPLVLFLLWCMVAVSAAVAYRDIKAPCLLVPRGGPMASRLLAYCKISGPADLLISLSPSNCQVLNYSFGRKAISPFLLSYGGNWRSSMARAIDEVPPGDRVFVTNDVIAPSDPDTLEDWRNIAEANHMPISEVLALLQSRGALVRLETIPPDESLWELQRGHPTPRSR